MYRPSPIAFAALLLVACSAQNTTDPLDPGDVELQPPIQRLERMTVTGYDTKELVKEFNRGRSLLLALEHEEAAGLFDRLMRLADEPDLKSTSMFNAGVAYEGLGEPETALERYRSVLAEFPEQAAAQSGLVRQTRILGYLERWAELDEVATELLSRDEKLPVMVRIEAQGAKALALVEQGHADDAQLYVTRAMDLIESNRFGQSGVPPVQLAQVSFAQGEIRRINSERIKLIPVTADFPQLLEARCQGLLDAQRAYTEAMRSRDAHWSAMSGFRVGQLYQQLHREAMEIPAPKQATTLRQKQLFEAAMRLRYRILLEKGLRMMDGTVRLGGRTGESSFWVTRARDAKRQLEQALEDEKAALAKMPFTEEVMQQALDKLRGKVRANKATAPSPTP